MEVSFTGNALFSVGGTISPESKPQGRNVTQYGFVDDLSHTMGAHTIKVGANLSVSTSPPTAQVSVPCQSPNQTLTDFFNGTASNFTQAFPLRSTQPVNLYNLGFYGQDSWHVKSNLTLTFAFRFDRNSNPACNTNCFNRLDTNFDGVNHDLSTPYNATILSGQSNALPSSYHPWTFQPRFGFNWSPFGGGAGLVISGGFGIFGSTLPAGYVDSLINNLPGSPAFTVSGKPLTPGTPGNAQSVAMAANTALQAGFANGANFNALNNAVLAASGGATAFSVPNFFNVGEDIHSPRFQEWNLQVEKAFGQKMSLSLKYVGNHGIWEQISNTGLNAYCGTTQSRYGVPCRRMLSAVKHSRGQPRRCALPFTSFNGLPTSPTDPRFLNITEISSGYNSNSNGMTVSFLRRFSSFQFQFNYTWAHALDMVSNAGQGITPFNFNTNTSITSPQNPFNVTQNMYGNADYDIRHYFSANYVYTTPKSMFNGYLGRLLGDWTIAGTIFARTGLPFTAVDTGTGGSSGCLWVRWSQLERRHLRGSDWACQRCCLRITVCQPGKWYLSGIDQQLRRQHYGLRQSTPQPGQRPQLLQYGFDTQQGNSISALGRCPT